MSENNISMRKCLLTLNNPQNYGVSIETLIYMLSLWNTIYFCLAAEHGAENGTYHIHAFIYFRNPVRFSTIKNKFPFAHIDVAMGTCRQNRDYIRKEGKWAETDKAETSVEGSFYESGDLPDERLETMSKQAIVLELIKEGTPLTEILDRFPEQMNRIDKMHATRDLFLNHRFLSETRPLEVNYIYGATGTGKTSGVYAKHPAADVCRITTYRTSGANFDPYNGEAVLVFEEYDSQIPLCSLLTYLDIYPLKLPARYWDRIACYNTVYILSNFPLEEQYQFEQKTVPQLWAAFLRRLDHIYEQVAPGKLIECDKSMYLPRWALEDTDSPKERSL